MPSVPCHFFFEATTRVIQHGRHLTRLIVARAPAWARAIAIAVALEVIGQLRCFADEWAARYVSFFCFDNADMH